MNYIWTHNFQWLTKINTDLFTLVLYINKKLVNLNNFYKKNVVII